MVCDAEESILLPLIVILGVDAVEWLAKDKTRELKRVKRN